MANFTAPNLTNLGGIPTYVNYATDGLFGIVMLLVVFAIGVIVVPGEQMKSKMFGSAYLTSLVSILFFIMGFIGESVMVGVVIAGAAALVINIVGE